MSGWARPRVAAAAPGLTSSSTTPISTALTASPIRLVVRRRTSAPDEPQLPARGGEGVQARLEVVAGVLGGDDRADPGAVEGDRGVDDGLGEDAELRTAVR